MELAYWVGALREDFFALMVAHHGVTFPMPRRAVAGRRRISCWEDGDRRVVLELGCKGKGRTRFKGLDYDTKLVLTHGLDVIPEAGSRLPLDCLGFPEEGRSRTPKLAIAHLGIHVKTRKNLAIIPLEWYDCRMRIKTSVSLSSEILIQVSHFAPGGERSEFIEKALWNYLELLRRVERDNRDLERINAAATYLNEAAEDTLGYQVPL